MFEDKIEAMNKLPNAVDDSSGFEKRVYTVEEIMDILSDRAGDLWEKENEGREHEQSVELDGRTKETMLANGSAESAGVAGMAGSDEPGL